MRRRRFVSMRFIAYFEADRDHAHTGLPVAEDELAEIGVLRDENAAIRRRKAQHFYVCNARAKFSGRADIDAESRKCARQRAMD